MTSMSWVSLNPFEFRAGLKLDRGQNERMLAACLNPFEFRAGLKQVFGTTKGL